MKIYAVYRCLYGEDFVQESIRSISDYVDKIFVFWTDKAWGYTTKCIYKGKEIIFPLKFDNVVDKIKSLDNEKVILYKQTHEMNPKSIPQGLYTTIINEHILPYWDKPDMFIIPEVDHVFCKDQIEHALNIMTFHELPIASARTRQVELWRSPFYRIDERFNRIGVVFWNMKYFDKLPYTKGNGEVNESVVLDAYVHNFGFAISYDTMFWKHMTALAFSSVIHDSIPDEDWFDRWVTWDFKTNNKDLEISKNYRHTITHAYPYNPINLPELIKEKYDL